MERTTTRTRSQSLHKSGQFRVETGWRITEPGIYGRNPFISQVNSELELHVLDSTSVSRNPFISQVNSEMGLGGRYICEKVAIPS